MPLYNREVKKRGGIMKILLADDSFAMRRIAMTKLKAAGYEDVIQVENGMAVLSTLKNNPDLELVLLDWNMPLMNGLDCLKAIRSIPATSVIPVVMVTAEANKSKIIEAIQSGASNYLIKTFEVEKLREVIGGFARRNS